jgi:DNA-binding IclR family transcriptional regulator
MSMLMTDERNAICGDANDTMSSASKALALLEVVAGADGGTVGVSDAAARSGLPKSTTHRLLKVLEDHSFVGRAGSKYRVGGRFFELCETVRNSAYGELRESAWNAMSWLYEQTRSTVHLAVLDGSDVVYLEKITATDGLRLPTRVGSRLPATCTGLGKAILAFSDPAVAVAATRSMQVLTRHSISVPRVFIEDLARARARGFATDFEEARLGISCVAAPVKVGGRAIAAISSCFPSRQELTSGRATAVRQAAAEIARLMPDGS